MYRCRPATIVTISAAAICTGSVSPLTRPAQEPTRRHTNHVVGRVRQRGVDSDRLRDLQPAVAGDQLAGETQGGSESGGPKRPLRRDGDASDPESTEPLGVGTGPDAREQRAQHPAPPNMLEREAVPDVTLTIARRDRQLELTDPFGLRRQPSVPGDLIAKPRPEAPAASRHPRRDEIPIRTHGRGD